MSQHKNIKASKVCNISAWYSSTSSVQSSAGNCLVREHHHVQQNSTFWTTLETSDSSKTLVQIMSTTKKKSSTATAKTSQKKTIGKANGLAVKSTKPATNQRAAARHASVTSQTEDLDPALLQGLSNLHANSSSSSTYDQAQTQIVHNHYHYNSAGPETPDTMSQLKITKPAPDFRGQAVVDGEFKEIKLSDFKGKYLVFFFYPLDFTFVCPTEIIAFSDRVKEFRAINCEVVGCSTDSHFSHLAWVNTSRKEGGLGPMKIPLLADKTAEISKAYGVLKEDEGISFRGLFIIDGKGNLRQITVNDLPVGRSVDETLRLVQAFQFTDKHGEVCPAGWKPGSDTMKPDTKKSKSYFSKVN